MYIADLSKYPSQFGPPEEHDMNLIAVGWLDTEHTYDKGDVSSDFTNRLKVFCSKPMLQNFGIVPCCPLCSESITIILGSGEEIPLFGTYEIRIPSKDGKQVYAGTDFIIHYILSHGYKPPQEFIDAVLAAPLPGTLEFEEFAVPWAQYR